MGAVRGDGAAGGGAGWVGGSPAAAAAEFSGDRGGRIWELKMKGAVGLGYPNHASAVHTPTARALVDPISLPLSEVATKLEPHMHARRKIQSDRVAGTASSGAWAN
jgi:hypothetical protein